MPLEFHSASAMFQRTLNQFINPDMAPLAFVYQDNIMMIGRKKEEHMANLTEVLRRLKMKRAQLPFLSKGDAVPGPSNKGWPR